MSIQLRVEGLCISYIPSVKDLKLKGAKCRAFKLDTSITNLCHMKV